MTETITLTQRGPPGAASLPLDTAAGIPATGDFLLYASQYGIWVYKTSVAWSTGFASVGSNAFAKCLPGNAVVICQCSDANHVALLGETGLVQFTY